MYFMSILPYFRFLCYNKFENNGAIRSICRRQMVNMRIRSFELIFHA